MRSNYATLHGVSRNKPLVKSFGQVLASPPPVDLMSADDVPFETVNTRKREAGFSMAHFGSLLEDRVSITQQLPGGKVRVLVDVTEESSTQNEGAFTHTQDSSGSKTSPQLFAFPVGKNVENDRLSVVVDMIINEDGSLQDSIIYKMRTQDKAGLNDNLMSGRGELDG